MMVGIPGAKELPLPHKQPGVVANVIRGCLGNLVEWYDWFVYASFSIYFAASFFPEGNLTAQLLSTAVVFAVGFLMRPLGGWLLGLYADKFGRRAALTLSVTLMSFGSLAIAVTPGYASIGILAPVILVVARLAQGLSVGGEFGSSATYLSEIATSRRRGFYSSFQYVSITVGQLAALLVMIVMQSLLTEAQMYAWGWRIPFALGAIAGLVVMYLRRSMMESEHFQLSRASGSSPRGGLRILLRSHFRQVLAVLGLAIGGTVAFYTFTSYLQKYMVNTAGIPKPTASLIGFAALFLFVFMQPVAGALSDRWGRRPVMFGFSIGGMLLTVPIMTLVGKTSDPWMAFLLMITALIFLSGYTALSAIIKAEMFPTNVRALGVGLPHALATAIFGGLSEPIALALKQAGHESVFFWWVTGCIALTFVATLVVREPSRGSSLEVSALPARDSLVR
ncbi:MFS transporter [Amycolatopsis umgeniensis]|uniref:MFS transporter n=1 Tax=Amycolatopsis umgeniensis TaxID=336628 RepID=UPI00161BC54E|nr:MFS transporter [Amycolatopsis umgeniensis]